MRALADIFWHDECGRAIAAILFALAFGSWSAPVVDWMIGGW